MSDHALFAVTPYAALVVLVAVTLLRYLLFRQRGRPSDERAAGRALLGGQAAWRIGLGGLLVLHLLLVAFPGVVLAWNRSLPRLVALEALFFAFGMTALVGLIDLVVRHLGRGARARSSPADSAFLGLLVITVVSGLSLAVLYRWASAWSVVTLTPFVRSLLQLDPALRLVGEMPYLVKLHVFSSLALLALFPFTRLVYAVLVPLDRAAGLVAAPLRRLGQRGRKRLEDALRVGGRRLGLIEEED